MQLVAVWGPVVYLGSLSFWVANTGHCCFLVLRPNLTMFFEVMVYNSVVTFLFCCDFVVQPEYVTPFCHVVETS